MISRKFKLLALACVIGIPFLVFLFSLFTNGNKKQTPQPIPQKGIIVNTQYPDQQYTIVSTNPSQGQTNVARTQPITLTFNQTVETIPHFSLLPSVQYSMVARGNTVTITPTNSFEVGQMYSLVVTLPRPTQGNDTLYQLVFTIAGPTPTLAPDTTDQNLFKNDDESTKNARPDVFLSNYTPYTSSTFSVASDYKTDPTGHFFFTVTIHGDQNSGRADLTNWMKSLGLTDSQIQSLDITYQ
jgi:hypothetical protein